MCNFYKKEEQIADNMEEVIIHCYTSAFKYMMSLINFGKQNYLGFCHS